MRLSIRLKLIVPLVAGLIFIAVATAVLMRFVHERAVDSAALHEVERAAEALDAQEEAEIDRLSALAEALSGDAVLGAALARGDRAALLAEAGPIFQRLRDAHGVTQLSFHPADPRRGVLLRVHRPELFGDEVRRPALRRSVETGKEAAGREFGRTAYAVRVVRPWLLAGKVVGYLELGTDLPAFLGRLKRSSGDEYGLLLDKRQLEPAAWAALTGRPERWAERPELIEATATGGGDRLSAGLGRLAQVPQRPTVLERVHDGGRTFARGLFPLRGPDGEVVGAVTVLHEITPLLAGMDELRVQVVVLVSLLAAALAALVVFLLEAMVFERVDRMSRVLEELPDRLARGELARPEPRPRADDEIGRVEGFLDQALAAVGSFVTDARRTPRPAETKRRRSDDF